MSWAEWGALDAIAMSHLVRAGEVTAQELAEQAAEAIGLLDPALNAVVEVFDDAVAGSRGESGEGGPFQGVPILVKDALWGMEGRLQEWGTLLRKGVRADRDDPLVGNLRRAGFNLIGRTALPAFAHADVTESFLHGITRNPWDPALSPGGSSGGSAAAVASGMVPLATASDSGGSTRGPASFCGLVGLKGTRGLLPLGEGRSELTAHSYMDGILTRSVRDHALAYDRMIRRGTADKSFIPFDRSPGSFSERIGTDPPRLRVALSTGPWGFDGPIDASSIDQAQKVAAQLEALGHSVDEVQDPEICDFESLSESALFHFSSGFALTVSSVSSETGVPISEDTLEPALFQVYRAARDPSISELMRSQELTVRASEQWARFFGRHDVLVSPVEPGRTWQAGTSEASPLFENTSRPDGLGYVATLMDLSRYCWPANDTGIPSIAVPVGLLDNGLPSGALIHSAWGNDGLLLQLGAQLERAKAEWFGPLPTLHAVHL